VDNKDQPMRKLWRPSSTESINLWLRVSRLFFAGPDRGTAPSPCLRQREAFWRSSLQVRFFYAGLVYLAAVRATHWSQEVTRQVVEPLWPVFWLPWVSPKLGVSFILLLHLVGALCATCFPEALWARSLAFLGLLEYGAFNNSFGKIGHSEHAWVLASLVFIFLPWPASRDPSRAERQAFLQTFWTAQASILLTYSMAGWSKIGGAFLQAWRGEPSLFSLQALSRHIAARLLETGVQSLWGPWLLAHPWIGWPLLWGVVYLQAFSFWVAFRPTLRAVWAVWLIAFHLASFFAMGIFFAQAILLLGILFLPEGVGSEGGRWGFRWAKALPLIGDIPWALQKSSGELRPRVRCP
jgi:hypothetical protein